MTNNQIHLVIKYSEKKRRNLFERNDLMTLQKYMEEGATVKDGRAYLVIDGIHVALNKSDLLVIIREQVGRLDRENKQLSALIESV